MHLIINWKCHSKLVYENKYLEFVCQLDLMTSSKLNLARISLIPLFFIAIDVIIYINLKV